MLLSMNNEENKYFSNNFNEIFDFVKKQTKELK